jgi:hypothetical protein
LIVYIDIIIVEFATAKTSAVGESLFIDIIEQIGVRLFLLVRAREISEI